MARDIISGIGTEEQLQGPDQNIVDTYVRPAQPAPSSLHGLADALSNFSHDISGFVSAEQKKQDEADQARAEKAALEENGKGWQEAVSSGAVPSWASPAFVKAYKRTQGSILGKQMAQAAQDAYNTWPQRNSQDPNDFDNFLGGFIHHHLDGITDPDVLNGALPYVQNASSDLIVQNGKDRDQQLYQNSISSAIASSAMTVDAADDKFLTTKTPEDYDAIWSSLMQDRQKAIASGIRADDYDKAMTGMIISKSQEHMDPGLLGLLGNKVPGQNFTYADADGGITLEKAKEDLISKQHAQSVLEAQEQAKADKEQKDKNTAYVIQNLAANPNWTPDPEFMRQAVALDPKLKVEMKQWGATLAQGEPEDPTEIKNIQAQLFAGAGVEVITDAMGPGGAIHDPKTVASMYNLYNSIHEHQFQPILDNQTYKSAVAKIGHDLTPTSADAFYDPSHISDAAIAARLDFQQSMLAWAKANPEQASNYMAVSQQAAKTLKEIESGYGTNQQTGEQTYQTPLDLQISQPEVPTNPLAPAETVKAPPAPEPKPEDVWHGDKPPALADLPQDAQDRINVAAKERGVSTDSLIQGIYARMQAHYKPEADTSGYTPTPDAYGSNADSMRRQTQADQELQALQQRLGIKLDPQDVQQVMSILDRNLPSAGGGSLASTGDSGLRDQILKGAGGQMQDPHSYLDPRNNPDVQPVVLKRFKGRKLPVSIRNNNPSAISHVGPLDNWWVTKLPGFVGTSPRPRAEGGVYAKFASPEYGLNAASQLLKRYGKEGINTAAHIVSTWSTDRAAWGNYAQALVKELRKAGYDVNTNTPLDMNDPKLRMAILKAQSAHESGAGRATYDDAVYERAIALDNGIKREA